jgi:tetratricopeptide (TPR) repeat protein
MKRLLASWAVALGLAGATVVVDVRRADAQEDEESQLLVEAARRALAKKNYPEAGRLLDQALSISPRRIDLYVLRASVHGVQKEHAKAIALLERAQKLAPGNASVETALGIQLVQSGKTQRGVPMLQRIVQRDASRYDAQVVLGHYYVKDGSWPEAAKAFDAYFQYRPGAIAGEDHLHKADYANALLRGGDPRKARALYDEVLKKNPKSEMARLGVAWAAAATDCREAMPLFNELADLEAKYGEVSLVRGRCALLLGRLDEALAAAERYRKAKPDAGDGWALLGDVQAAKKNQAAAETAYARALAAEPDNKVYAFKLGRTERLLGKTEQAAERLKSTGAPRYFEDDWTLEYAETLYALGQPQALKDHVSPWAEAHAGHPQGQFFLGVALYQLGETETAVLHLEKATDEPRAKKPLIDALNVQAVAALQAGKKDQARDLFERAVKVGDDVLTWRNLGAMLLSTGAPADIDRAAKLLKQAADRGRDDAIAWHLLARAYQGNKQFDDARAAYQRAIKAYGKDKRVAAAQLDLANAELAAGRGEQAVDVLEAAAGTGDAETRAMLSKALVDAARAAATDAMRSGKFGSAVRVLKQIEKRVGDDTDVRCDLALASTGNGQRDAALEHLRKLEKAKVKCPFVAPADELAVPILIAWNEGATLRKARQALQRLDKIRSKARGVAEPLARMAARDIALRAATEAYADGNLRQAGKFLEDAKLYDKRSPELAHNYAVIMLANGDVDAAINELERIKGDVPEAYVNLGIAYDRKREPQRALEYWKRAQNAGVRYSPLKDWIEAKERFWGGQ